MERWAGRVAVVTGASVGIGAAIVKELVKKGMTVVGLARRVENIEVIANELSGAPGKLYGVKADFTREEDILNAFRWVKDNMGGVDVLVNNAGVLNLCTISGGSTGDWRQMYAVNVQALSICTREAIKSMKDRGVDDGHIIHINSVAGHEVLRNTLVSVYSSTKHAVIALAEGLRRELSSLKSHIRITCVSPGAVDTDMMKQLASDVLAKCPLLQPEDIVAAVIYTLSTPTRVQVHEIIIRPVGEMV